MDHIIKKALITGIVWCVGFFLIRRMLNPNRTLFDKNFNIKTDEKSRKKLIEYVYDSVYGGLSAFFAVLVIHIINETPFIKISNINAFNAFD